MPDEDRDHNEEDDTVEEKDGKDGTQKSSKEYSNLTNEAAGKEIGVFT